MQQRPPSTTAVVTGPNQLIPVNPIPQPTGPGGPMAYAQPTYAAHPMTVGSMGPMSQMGPTGPMPPQPPGTQATMYGYPSSAVAAAAAAAAAGRPGPGPPHSHSHPHPQGIPGGMQMVVNSAGGVGVGVGRGMAAGMPLNTPVQQMVRYAHPQTMTRGMTMPASAAATMAGPGGRGGPSGAPPGMVMTAAGLRMQPGPMSMVQRVGVGPGMHQPPPGQPGVGVGPGGHPMGGQQGPTVMSYPASGSMQPGGVMMVPPQHSPIKQPVQLFPQNTGPNPNMGMQNGPPTVNPQMQTSASPVRNPSPSVSGSAAATPANAPTPGQRARAPTPAPRPGTANHSTGPTGYATQHTPIMQHMEVSQSVNTPPGSGQRNPQPNAGGPPPGPGGPMQPVNPGIFRQTPAQMISDHYSMAMMGAAAPVGAAAAGATRFQGQPGPPTSQPGARIMNMPPVMTGLHSQPIPPGGPLQPQLTGGPQPPQPLVSQQTGGSIHGLNDVTMAGPGQPGTSSVPSTPSLSHKPAVMSGGPGVGGAMQPPSSTPMTMKTEESNTNLAESKPPPNHLRHLPPELNAITSMGVGAIPRYPNTRHHSFGVLRLLSLSQALNANNDPQKIPGLHDDSYWTSLLSQHFTPDASLSVRPRSYIMNPYAVGLHFSLIVRFFSTISQASIYRMSFSLDGARETQEGQEYSVYSPNARWLMHYSNGWVISLLGELQAKCKLVPIPFGPGAPGLLSHHGPHIPPTDSNSSPAQTKLQSPHSQPGGVSPSPQPVQNVPYMAKISDFIFDVVTYSRSFDLDIVQRPPAPDAMAVDYNNTIPPEPPLNYGLPDTTMRMIEMVESANAIGPILDFADHGLGPIEAMHNLAYNYSSSGMPGYPYMASIFGGRLPEGVEGYVKVENTIPTGFPGGLVKAGTIVKREPLTQDTITPASSSTGASSSTLVASSEKTGGAGSSTSTAPSLSPTLTPKTTSKKSNAGPGSPTKGGGDKEKGSSKRKSTVDNSDGPNKRRAPTRKASKAS